MAAPPPMPLTRRTPPTRPGPPGHQGGNLRCRRLPRREWRDDLDADYAALQEIYNSVKDLTPADDAKLHAVKSLVAAPGVSAEKLLIFTESNVTARYLYDELSQSDDSGAVDILTGGDARGVDKAWTR